MREPPITPRALPLGLALVLGLALATPVRAQLDPPSLPDVYGEIVKTWRDTGRFIFPWERASQIISVRAHSNRYCEETDTSFLPLPVDGRLGDVGSGSAWISQVGCNYITSLGGVVPTPTEISLGIDPERDEANLFLREVALGGSWTATAVLDPTSPASPFGKLYEGGDDAAEVTNNTLTRSFTADDTYALLSGTVRLGAARGDVVAGTGWVLEDSFDCGGDLELRSADLVIRLGDGWGTTTIEASEPWLVCAVAVPNGSGAYDLDITYIDPIARTVTGVVGGLTAKASFTIEADGLHASQVAVRLPAGHTLHTARSLQVHEMIEQVPTPRGTSWVPFEGLAPAVAATLTELTATRNLGSGRFLVSREVPLGFLIDEIGLLPEGLVASAVSARYLRKLPVHRYAEDHPIRKGPRANDVALGAATPAQGIRIDGQGMRTSVTLASGTGVTALPRGTLTWPGADLAIERGALARQAQAIDAFTLEQDGGCPGCGNAGGLDRTLSLTASAGTVAG
ncbi:MAG: hypothetical protein IT385_28385, partial [Deltaproteobacteria bacterium]|nr:hypothetical protein [Deltaproteobacteria bacterium]